MIYKIKKWVGKPVVKQQNWADLLKKYLQNEPSQEKSTELCKRPIITFEDRNYTFTKEQMDEFSNWINTNLTGAKDDKDRKIELINLAMNFRR